ncbi:MAG TPA: ATP-binding protein [Gammaproteobacteria bacterium]
MRLTTIEKKVLAGFAASLLLLAAMAVSAGLSIRAFVSASRWVTHTYDVLQTVEAVRVQVQASELHTRAFILTGNPARLDQRKLAHDQADHALDTLRTLTSDNRLEQVRLALLRGHVMQLHRNQQRMIDARRQQQAGAAAELSGMAGTYQLLQQIDGLLENMEQSEKQLLNQRIEHARVTAIYTVAVFALLAVSMFGIKLYLFLRIKDEVQERERMDEDLIRAKQVLEATNKELESFSYSISHDLRSPLRAVNGFARILDAEYGSKLDDEGRRIISVIVRNSEKMSALIDDLLAFSRVGRDPVSKGEVNMAALVSKVHSDLTTASEYASTQFSLGDLPNADGDPAMLTQVWSNLIGNALKYSSRNPAPEVTVAGELRDGECIYSVQDNGVGFDMKYYGKLFGVFQRLHSDAEYPGTGVGLAIAQRIVTRHGGRIWAEATPGQGATFRFSLPREARA